MSNSKSRLIIMVNNETQATQSALLNLFREESVAWFHRFANVWFISDPQERSTVWWRDKLKNTVKNDESLFVTPSHGGSAFYMPEDWHEWVLERWN